MKSFRHFALSLAALFFGLLLVPRSVLAQVTNCPKEPTQTTIAGGQVYVGTNCVVSSPGDTDSFTFKATKGEIYQVVSALNGFTVDICMTIYDPNGNGVTSGCTDFSVGGDSVAVDLTIATTGTYSVDITEPVSGTESYAVSLERIFPAPPNAQAAQLNTLYTGDVAALAQSNAFSYGVVTTGQFRVTATLPSNPTNNLCLTVFSAIGAGVGGGCTDFAVGGTSVQINFTPAQNGTGVALVSVAGNDGTLNGYTLEVSCVSGSCNTHTPPCTLKDSLSYSSSTDTLTMTFTEGNTAVDTWNVWLTTQNSITNLFTVSQPITNPPQVIPKTTTLSPSGTVGVLTTLTTPTKGIICSNYTQFNTGTPAPAGR